MKAMRIWELRDHGVKYGRGEHYGYREGSHEKSVEEAYECGYEAGYEEAMEEIEGGHYGHRSNYRRMRR